MSSSYGNQIGYDPEKEELSLRVVELEKMLNDKTISSMQTGSNNDSIVGRMSEMKTKFNEIVRSKYELQQELILSEEEKL